MQNPIKFHGTQDFDRGHKDAEFNDIHLNQKIGEETEHQTQCHFEQHHYKIILSTLINLSSTSFVQKTFDRQTFVETD